MSPAKMHLLLLPCALALVAGCGGTPPLRSSDGTPPSAEAAELDAWVDTQSTPDTPADADGGPADAAAAPLDRSLADAPPRPRTEEDVVAAVLRDFWYAVRSMCVCWAPDDPVACLAATAASMGLTEEVIACLRVLEALPDAPRGLGLYGVSGNTAAGVLDGCYSNPNRTCEEARNECTRAYLDELAAGSRTHEAYVDPRWKPDLEPYRSYEACGFHPSVPPILVIPQ